MADILISIAAGLAFLVGAIYFENILSGIFLALIILLSLFVINIDHNSRLYKIRNIIGDYLKQNFNYLKISFSVALYFYLTTIINPDLSLIVSFLLLSILLKLDDRASFVAALFFLALCPLLIIFQKEDLAEIMAIYAYYFLCLGVIWQIISMTPIKSKLALIPHPQIPIPTITLPKITFNIQYQSLPKQFYLAVFDPIIGLIQDVRLPKMAIPTIKKPIPVKKNYRQFNLFWLNLKLDFAIKKAETIMFFKTLKQVSFNIGKKIITFNYINFIFGPVIELIKIPRIRLPKLTFPKIKLPQKNYAKIIVTEQLPQLELPPVKKTKLKLPVIKIRFPRISVQVYINSIKWNLRKFYLVVFDPVFSALIKVKLPQITLPQIQKPVTPTPVRKHINLISPTIRPAFYQSFVKDINTDFARSQKEFNQFKQNIITMLKSFQLPQIKPPEVKIPQVKLPQIKPQIVYFGLGIAAGLIIVLIYPSQQNIKSTGKNTIASATKTNSQLTINVVGESDEKITAVISQLQSSNQTYKFIRNDNQPSNYYQPVIVHNSKTKTLAETINSNLNNGFVLTENAQTENNAITIYVK